MKPDVFNIVAIIAILITVLISGCTGENPPITGSGSMAATQQVTQATIRQTILVTPVPTMPGCAYPPLNPWTWVPESYEPVTTTKIPPEPGAMVSKADLFGTPSLKWEEYAYFQKIRSLPDSQGISRMEKTRKMHQGRPAIHENHTYFLLIEGMSEELADTTMDDMYYDEYGNMISMHRRVIRNGEFLEDADRPPVNMSRGTPDCSGTVFALRYTFVGKDPVTVPAGHYPDAMKYTRKDIDESFPGKETLLTYWIDPAVPEPVKIVIDDPGEGLLFTYELRGWG
ncbi:hypothetical protein [Methanoregula formicica]|uniref:Lipoprotein n=1 Tax=Methanoregula formicica (strain DSM 22288 / NBRC 105244 / SMSP) TaxID=593750 RepID=L0HED1_METFS|nr:hypothetical protein [Methanoregula formicica]AGB03097.1 hypothetical protein Metfor_2090 [Methanoregula formicica SMSP]